MLKLQVGSQNYAILQLYGNQSTRQKVTLRLQVIQT